MYNDDEMMDKDAGLFDWAKRTVRGPAPKMRLSQSGIGRMVDVVIELAEDDPRVQTLMSSVLSNYFASPEGVQRFLAEPEVDVDPKKDVISKALDFTMRSNPKLWGRIYDEVREPMLRARSETPLRGRPIVPEDEDVPEMDTEIPYPSSERPRPAPMVPDPVLLQEEDYEPLGEPLPDDYEEDEFGSPSSLAQTEPGFVTQRDPTRPPSYFEPRREPTRPPSYRPSSMPAGPSSSSRPRVSLPPTRVDPVGAAKRMVPSFEQLQQSPSFGAALPSVRRSPLSLSEMSLLDRARARLQGKRASWMGSDARRTAARKKKKEETAYERNEEPAVDSKGEKGRPQKLLSLRDAFSCLKLELQARSGDYVVGRVCCDGDYVKTWSEHQLKHLVRTFVQAQMNAMPGSPFGGMGRVHIEKIDAKKNCVYFRVATHQSGMLPYATFEEED